MSWTLVGQIIALALTFTFCIVIIVAMFVSIKKGK